MAADGSTITIDGKKYTVDDLTFGEQRELRQAVRDLAEDQTIQVPEAALMDFLPALVWVIVKRDNPNYSIEEALDQRFDDVFPPKPRARAKTPSAKTAGDK